MDEALDHPPLQMVLAEEVYAALVVGPRGAGAEGKMEKERCQGTTSGGTLEREADEVAATGGGLSTAGPDTRHDEEEAGHFREGD